MFGQVLVLNMVHSGIQPTEKRNTTWDTCPTQVIMVRGPEQSLDKHD